MLYDVHFLSLTTVSIHHLPQENDTFVQVLVGHWWHLEARSNAGNSLKYHLYMFIITASSSHDMIQLIYFMGFGGLWLYKSFSFCIKYC